MRAVELLIFDLDGVLVDSEPISCRCAAEALARVGIRMDAAQVMDRFLGIGRAELARYAESELGRPLPPSFMADLGAALRSAFEAELRPIPGVREAVARLGLARCVASASDPDYIRHALELTGLLDLFTPHLFSATMVVRGKPAPDVFLHAAQRMAAAPAGCLVIEDSDAGVRAAKAAGMTVFGFTGGSHSAAAKLGARMQAAGCDLQFDAMDRLPALVGAVRSG